METSKIKSSILAFSTMLLSVGFMQAQTDTTRMPMGGDTTRIQTGTGTETETDTRIRDDEGTDVNIQNETNVYDTETEAAPVTTPVTTPVPVEDDHRDWWHDDDDDDDFHAGELGLRYMPTFSRFEVNTYDGGEVVQGEVSASNGVELIGGVNFNRHVGIMAGVGYNQFQQKYKDRGLDRQVNLSYINIPLLLQLNTSKSEAVNFNVVVGPQFGINVGADADTHGETATATVAVKGGDVGVAYGAGLEFGLTPDRMLRLDLGFRGMYGLVDVSDRQTGDTYTISIKGARQSYAGYVGLAWAF